MQAAEIGSCRFDAYAPKVMLIGDSIPYGVGCSVQGSYRETLFNLATSAGTPFRFVGSQTGFAGGLAAVNNQCECYPGASIRDNGVNQSLLSLAVPKIPTYQPDILILQGMTNDAGILGDDSTTILNSIRTQLQNAWALRIYAHTRIIQFGPLHRYDDAGFNSTLLTVRAGIQAVIAGLSFASAVTYVDIYDSVTFPTNYTGGGLHPLDAGDTQTGNVVWPSLQAAIAVARGAT